MVQGSTVPNMLVCNLSFFYSLLDIQHPNRMAPSKVQNKTGVERKGGALSNPSVVRTSLLKVITAKKP